MRFYHLRIAFVPIFALALIVALSSCSKKDVVQDEPSFSATEGAGAPADQATAPTTEGTDNAAAAGAKSSEFKTVYFAFDSYKLDGAAREALKANAEWLKNNASATIQVEGHCDERGTTEYNVALGERRANATMDYLVKLGIPKSRLSVISYGEERPADPGHDETAWSKNRRAEFVILSK